MQCLCTIWLNTEKITEKQQQVWNYYRDELSNDTNNSNNLNKNVINSESFKYKTSITGSTYNVNGRITNAEGNQVNNPDYDANKSGKKKILKFLFH